MSTVTYTEFRQAVLEANDSLISICDKLYNNAWLAKVVYISEDCTYDINTGKDLVAFVGINICATGCMSSKKAKAIAEIIKEATKIVDGFKYTGYKIVD